MWRNRSTQVIGYFSLSGQVENTTCGITIIFKRKYNFDIRVILLEETCPNLKHHNADFGITVFWGLSIWQLLARDERVIYDLFIRQLRWRGRISLSCIEIRAVVLLIAKIHYMARSIAKCAHPSGILVVIVSTFVSEIRFMCSINQDGIVIHNNKLLVVTFFLNNKGVYTVNNKGVLTTEKESFKKLNGLLLKFVILSFSHNITSATKFFCFTL